MALKYLYVPSGYKAGKTYGVLPNATNADLSLVRSTTATRINADGLIKTMGANVPRLDYTDGSCPTLLTEPESTNLLEYSEDFSQWDKINGGTGVVPVVSAGFSAPDGTQGASRVVFDLNGGTTISDFSRIKDTVTATTPTMSIFIKSNDANTHQLNLSYGGGELGLVTAKPNEWSRVEVQATSSGSFDYRLELRGSLTTDDSADVLIWGAQAENKEYATSYIPTSGAAETRAADTGVISGDLSSYINSSEGVLEIKAKALFNGGNDCRITLSDGTNDDRVGLIWFSSPNNTSVIVQKDASTVVNSNLNIDQTLMTTFKIKWKSGDIQVKVNGTVVLTDTSTFSGLILDQLSFSKGTEQSFFEGNVQYIKVYDSITDF
jgi:hypothetical protein